MSADVCTAPGCDKSLFTKSLCDMHRTRMRRYGSLEPKGRHRVNVGPCSVEDCDEPSDAKGYCSVHYLRTHRWGDPGVVKVIRDPEERFWSKVSKSECCWMWTDPLTHDSYGIFRAGYKRTGAHRWPFMFAGIEIPPGMHVDHLCRVRSCVRPNHLEIVTPKVNRARQGRPPSCACGEQVRAEQEGK